MYHGPTSHRADAHHHGPTPAELSRLLTEAEDDLRHGTGRYVEGEAEEVEALSAALVGIENSEDDQLKRSMK